MRTLVIFGFVLAAALIGGIAHFAPSADYIRPRTWALIWETSLAVVVSLAVTTILFWVLDSVRAIQQIILPGRDEARQAETVVMRALQTRDTSQQQVAAMLFLGLSLRGASRIISVALIFAVVLWTFAPLS